MGFISSFIPWFELFLHLTIFCVYCSYWELGGSQNSPWTIISYVANFTIYSSWAQIKSDARHIFTITIPELELELVANKRYHTRRHKCCYWWWVKHDGSRNDWYTPIIMNSRWRSYIFNYPVLINFRKIYVWWMSS